MELTLEITVEGGGRTMVGLHLFGSETIEAKSSSEGFDEGNRHYWLAAEQAGYNTFNIHIHNLETVEKMQGALASLKQLMTANQTTRCARCGHEKKEHDGVGACIHVLQGSELSGAADPICSCARFTTRL